MVLSFGQIADLTGPTLENRERCQTPNTLGSSCYGSVSPGSGSMTYVVAVDKKTIRENTPLHSSSVVALLPPFSGG